MLHPTFPLDSKKRINLGEKIIRLLAEKIEATTFKIYVGEDGDILLRPVVTIPAKEAWIYKNPVVIESLKKGLSDAGEQKIRRVEDLEDFFKKL